MWRLARIALRAADRAVSASASAADSRLSGATRSDRLCPCVFMERLLRWWRVGGGYKRTRNMARALLLGTPFLLTSGSRKDGLTYGILTGYNYQKVGQFVLGVEGDFQGWTVGAIRYTAITGDFLTAHSKWAARYAAGSATLPTPALLM